MRILVAPDKFKDALTASEAAAAIAAGIEDAFASCSHTQRGRPRGAGHDEMQIVRCPMADGGDGTGRVLAGALGAEEHQVTVLDPRGRLRQATWWRSTIAPAKPGVGFAGAATAVVEMAEASGLALLPPGARDPLATTSYGTGQLLAAASDANVARVLLCVGGSATVDGGAGCLQALGWDLVDDSGAVLDHPATGADLTRIAEIRPRDGADPRSRPEIRVLCDVDNPLLGPDGAAARFGPQKGAGPAAVELLERGLSHWASVLERQAGGPVDFAGAGAAGGLPAALSAVFGAHVRRGFDEVAQVVAFDEKLRACDLCMTGEGRLDEQTLRGKVVCGVAGRARNANVPVVAFVGTIHPPPRTGPAEFAQKAGLTEAIVITPPGVGLETALRDASANLRRCVRGWLQAAIGAA